MLILLTAPRISPSAVNAMAGNDSATLNCDVALEEENVVWYKLTADSLVSFPRSGTSCEVSGSGSGSGEPLGDLFAGDQFNVTGEIVANGNFSLTFAPVMFDDEGYYACVVMSGGRQRCFSDYVTVTGELQCIAVTLAVSH